MLDSRIIWQTCSRNHTKQPGERGEGNTEIRHGMTPLAILDDKQDDHKRHNVRWFCAPADNAIHKKPPAPVHLPFIGVEYAFLSLQQSLEPM